MKPIATAVLSAFLAAVLAQPVFAKKDRDGDDDDRRGRGKHHGHQDRDDDEGRGRGPWTKFDNNAEVYKYEYQDASCRYKYEYKYKTGKTKVQQKGDCSAVAFARPAMVRETLPRAIPPEPHATRIECNRDVIGAVLGGAAGAVIGYKVGDRGDRPITTIGGAVIGAVIGGAIGREMDQADQACAAQALEYANLKQSVAWRNPRGQTYTVTPLGLVPGAKGVECRKYVVRTASGTAQENTACRQSDGSWAALR
jgi:surface antigen